MTGALPPSPHNFRDLNQWANQLFEYMVNDNPRRNKQDPQPILLAHRTTDGLERATVDGLLAYDPMEAAVNVAKNNAWAFLVNSVDVKNIVLLANEAAYTALTPKDPYTLYIWP